jgi:hypothetical protein
MCTKFWFKSLKGRALLENQGMDEKIIKKGY